jgi:hypothetical protein
LIKQMANRKTGPEAIHDPSWSHFKSQLTDWLPWMWSFNISLGSCCMTCSWSWILGHMGIGVVMRKDDVSDLTWTFVFDLTMQLLEHMRVTVWITVFPGP